jgi:iron complex outermembrane receptor protein
LQSGNTTYNFFTYPNEVDNYGQDHYQLHWDQQWNSSLRGRLSAHYTRGKGFFEQFRYQDPLANYNLPPVVVGTDTVFNTDLVRRRWLDNHFFGLVGSLVYEDDLQQWVLGGAANRYLGDHFGEVIWARYASVATPQYRYYFSQSTKDDANLYLRGTRQWGKGWSVYADVQVRAVRYATAGTDNDLRNIAADANFLFFNPKAGLQYSRGKNVWYLSYAQANREPVRSDFIDAPAGDVPLPERLHNIEAGLRHQGSSWRAEINGFAMLYRNQLVLTGELNDVGGAVRTNVKDSRRLGVELQAQWQPTQQWSLAAHASASANTILNYEEYLYDYLNGTIDTNRFASTTIALSPALVAGATATWMPLTWTSVGLEGKYVSRQFLDNTSQVSRSLDAFVVVDAVVRLTPVLPGFPGLEVQARVNNLFNTIYAPNGYSYSYRFGEVVTENFFYPMARTNFLVNVTLRF